MVLCLAGCSPRSVNSKDAKAIKGLSEPVHLDSPTASTQASSEQDTTSSLESLSLESLSQKALRKNGTLRFLGPPRLKEIEVPDFSGAHSIWGATGRDNLGRIYFGVSAYGVDDPSARLMRLDPALNRFQDLGAVNNRLSELKQRRSDPYPEIQMKIHSKIVQAADGRMYFSSQDVSDEVGDGSKNSVFGGRLFALDPKTDLWECVLATPEGLIAVACNKRYVFAMGYFGHVLNQFDTETRQTRSIRLGTVGGHVSRNLFVDSREHVFAIRLAGYDGDETSGVSQLNGQQVRATLVELDDQLQEIAQTPLDDYQPTADTESHGMTGFARMLNGELVFVTHSGSIWQVSPGKDHQPSSVQRLGWFHPEGSVYVASLFSPTGSRFVGGFAKQKNQSYEWVVFDIEQRRSTAMALNATSRKLLERDGLIIYGCDTLGDQMQAYGVGWQRIAGGYGPSILQISWPELD